jgi:dinuclear metal center YbgI/SA1388 family protein
VVKVSDLLHTLDELAPFSLAESWDNCGLLVGDEDAPVVKLLVALELTRAVLDEAVARGFDSVLTHHPVVFNPMRRLVESEEKGALIRSVVRAGINVISCHTNLDAARGGLADRVADVLGLTEITPLEMADAGWLKFVGFIPPESLAAVSEAVFAAGAGVIGTYTGCAFAGEGAGWFRPQVGSRPAVGRVGETERVSEIRWETVVPCGRIDAVIRAYVAAHPYEEPAFDVHVVEDRLARVGLGRVGRLVVPLSVEAVADRLAGALGLEPPLVGGATEKTVATVAVLPGSGRSLLEQAARMADAFVTGDLAYHDADRAEELGLAVISVPHGELEWAAMRQWLDGAQPSLTREGVVVALSQAWRSAWRRADMEAVPSGCTAPGPRRVHLWIDGGSRGNPGPSAIGVVLKDDAGTTLEEVGKTIGDGTNNAAEYQALLEGLSLARKYGAAEVEINSDSELLVKQMLGEYRVKNEALRLLFAEAKRRAGEFASCAIRHVPRNDNARADELVNQALDAAGGKSWSNGGTRKSATGTTKSAGGTSGGTSGTATPGLF